MTKEPLAFWDSVPEAPSNVATWLLCSLEGFCSALILPYRRWKEALILIVTSTLTNSARSLSQETAIIVL